MPCELDLNSMDQNKLPQLAGDLYIAPCDDPSNLVNIGGVKALSALLDSDADRVEVKVNNRAQISGASVVPQMNVEFVETVDVEKIALLYNLTITVVAGTLVSGATETWTSGTREDLIGYPLANKNADGTAATINSITGSVDGALTELANDFAVTTNVLGETIITFDVTTGTALTTMDQDFVINYDYTPAAHSTLTAERKYKSDRRFRAVIVTEANADGQYNTIELKNCVFKGQYEVDIADLATAGDLKGTTGTFEGLRGSKMKFDIQTITA